MKKAMLAIVVVVAVAGIWFGRPLWAAHRGLVTLHVKNAPLAEVVRKVAAQVHQNISVGQNLDAKVTLDVNESPLANVLDLLAEQSGARWSKTHAVYDSTDALGRLENVLAGGATMDAAGWTNLAPRFAKLEMPQMNFTGGPGPHRIVVNSPDGPDGAPIIVTSKEGNLPDEPHGNLPKGAITVDTDDMAVGPDGGGKVIRMKGPGSGGGEPHKRVMMRVTRGPGGATTTTTSMEGNTERVNVTRTSADGTVLQQDDWSRERLVMVTALNDRLGDAIPEKASRETAEQVAAKVRGHYACYYALDKPPLGGDFGLTREMGGFDKQGGTNDPMAALKGAQFGGLGQLTPEQQVRRARQLREQQELSK